MNSHKWTYCTVRVHAGVVTHINDQLVAKVSFFAGVKGTAFIEYFNKLGADGWEAVGITNTAARETGVQEPAFTVLFKKPID